jgi:hypothetical protein
MTKVIGFLENCSYPKVLMFSRASDAPSSTSLPVLAHLAPSAVPTTALPSAFSQSSSHKYYHPMLLKLQLSDSFAP